MQTIEIDGVQGIKIDSLDFLERMAATFKVHQMEADIFLSWFEENLEQFWTSTNEVFFQAFAERLFDSAIMHMREMSNLLDMMKDFPVEDIMRDGFSDLLDTHNKAKTKYKDFLEKKKKEKH